MPGLPPILDKDDAPKWKKSKAPWRNDAIDDDAKDETSRRAKSRWRLFHYLSGGGSKAFGRTQKQEDEDYMQSRFLAAMGAVAAVWLYFWI